jgi:hypothetical protein
MNNIEDILERIIKIEMELSAVSSLLDLMIQENKLNLEIKNGN